VPGCPNHGTFMSSMDLKQRADREIMQLSLQIEIALVARTIGLLQYVAYCVGTTVAHHVAPEGHLKTSGYRSTYARLPTQETF
jgi:hypothetical protein